MCKEWFTDRNLIQLKHLSNAFQLSSLMLSPCDIHDHGILHGITTKYAGYCVVSYKTQAESLFIMVIELIELRIKTGFQHQNVLIG